MISPSYHPSILLKSRQTSCESGYIVFLFDNVYLIRVAFFSIIINLGNTKAMSKLQQHKLLRDPTLQLYSNVCYQTTVLTCVKSFITT